MVSSMSISVDPPLEGCISGRATLAGVNLTSVMEFSEVGSSISAVKSSSSSSSILVFLDPFLLPFPFVAAPLTSVFGEGERLRLGFFLGFSKQLENSSSVMYKSLTLASPFSSTS